MDKIETVEISMAGNPVGCMALTPDDLCVFEYNADYLKTGQSLSPYFLPLQSGLFVAKRNPFKGGFGVFDDSLPDGWGNLLLDRYLQQKGIEPSKLTILQRLSLVGTTGRGALEYRPDRSESIQEESVDFDKLAFESQKILTSNYTGDSLETLYKYAGSSGGARPKIFVWIEDKEWLVKFKTFNDPIEIGKIEYECSLLAKACGIDMPETRLFEGKYFGVERFDRTPAGKIHTISVAGLLNADYRIPSLDYSTLLKMCFDLTKDIEQVYSLFRLMVFNIVISNRDDHAKNFSFQLKNQEWKLSPAYDLLPSVGFNGYHTTTINGQGEPAMNDILTVATNAGLSKQSAEAIVAEIVKKCKAVRFLRKSMPDYPV
ncbi:MAG: type II toxin-antitoxin system HipA family toxin [Candidatus Symbiothrix sp.]|jgi:serine/threonine-protein kinase HipA|nr:type II toxin-antitoxin system HipA family toxin [Candidatus Symbiothrix sp.]